MSNENDKNQDAPATDKPAQVKPTCPRCGSEDTRGCFDPDCPCIPEPKS